MPEDTQGSEVQGQEGSEFNFDTWLGEQPDHVRKGLEGHTAGLRSALEKERDGRKDIVSQLKDMRLKADKGSEAERALGEISTQLEQANQRADFIAEAIRPEIGCSNPKTAFLVAQAEGLFKRSGEPDWEAIKQTAPELFNATRKTPPGNAGSGNGSPPAQKTGMNEWIRSASGRN